MKNFKRNNWTNKEVMEMLESFQIYNGGLDMAWNQFLLFEHGFQAYDMEKKTVVDLPQEKDKK